jgi:Mg2+ and Co2+ transporter CorA
MSKESESHCRLGKKCLHYRYLNEDIDIIAQDIRRKEIAALQKDMIKGLQNEIQTLTDDKLKYEKRLSQLQTELEKLHSHTPTPTKLESNTIRPGFLNTPPEQVILELKEELKQSQLTAAKYKNLDDLRREVYDNRLLAGIFTTVGCQTSFPVVVPKVVVPKPKKPTRSGLVKFQRAYLRMWHLHFEKHSRNLVKYRLEALRHHFVEKLRIQSTQVKDVQPQEKQLIEEMAAAKANWSSKESVYLKKIETLESDLEDCFVAIRKRIKAKTDRETQTEKPTPSADIKEFRRAEAKWEKEKEDNLRTISETKKDIAVYMDLLKKTKKNAAMVSSSSQTEDPNFIQKGELGWKLKIRRLVARCRDKHINIVVSKLARILLKAFFILRAKAADQLLKKDDPPDESKVFQEKMGIDHNLGADLFEQCSVLKVKQLCLDDKIERSFLDAVETQESIDTLRQEMLDFMIDAKRDLAKEKKFSSKLQTQLADLRQETLDLKNNVGSHHVPIIKLEQAVETLKLCLGDLKMPGQIIVSTEEIKIPETSLVNKTMDVACQSGFAVDNYEYGTLLRAAQELQTLNLTLPVLEGRTKNLELALARQDKVLEDASLLTAELRKVTEAQTSTYVKMQRQEQDERLLSVVAERRATKVSNKRAKLAVAKREVKKNSQAVLKEELDSAVPKIVSFVKEWNSLKKGDIYLYKGLALEVDNDFNPSLRVPHTGQNGDKWEAQKHANANWCRQLLFKPEMREFIKI